MTKYRSVRTEVDGVSFASKKEARRYSELKLLERAKKISGLTLQPRFPLIVEKTKVCTFVADFSYEENGKLVVEDVKGYLTDVYRVKKRLFGALHRDIDFREIR